MADAETLLMETMDQNGNEEEGGQDEVEQELMMGEEDQGDDTDGGKIEATKGDEDTGWVLVSLTMLRLRLPSNYVLIVRSAFAPYVITFLIPEIFLLYLQ